MADQFHDNMPLVTNQITEDVADIAESLGYLKDCFQKLVGTTWSNTDTSGFMIDSSVIDVDNSTYSVKYYGADPANSFADNNTAFADAIAANEGGYVWFPPGTYAGKISIDGSGGITLLGNNAVIQCESSGATNAVLEVKNSTAVFVHDLTIDGNYNLDLVAGVWGYTDDASALAYCSFMNVNVKCCPLAWKFGIISAEDALVSENYIIGGYTWGTPKALQAIGTQTVVHVTGHTLQSSTNGGAGDFLTLDMSVAETYGAYINITGGECLITSDSDQVCFSVNPITSATYSNPYGTISVSNCVIETASQLAITTSDDSDGDAVTSPTVGLIRLIGCSGYHASNSFSFIQTDADYPGKIIVKDCNFYCGTSRTQKNIECGNDDCDVYCDDHSFGANFIQGLAGITGGTVHFGYRQILKVANLNGQSLPGSAQTDLKFTSITTTGDLGRFSDAYNASTGVFTIPHGGLKNIFVRAQFSKAGVSLSELYIKVGSSILGAVSAHVAAQICYSTESLAAAETIKITLNNLDGALTADSDALDQFDIFASNP